MSHIQRTKFKDEIISEFLIPEGGSDSVIILAGGMPGYPEKSNLMRSLMKCGFTVFNPRYRGTWESKGQLLERSPHEDILDIIDELPNGFKSAWDGEEFRIDPKEIIIIGSSFGGPAALLASRDSRVRKVIVVSSVVDWTVPSEKEPLDFLFNFIKKGFGGGYRISNENWKKLEKGQFYNPVSHATEIEGRKVLMIHAVDDEIVAYESVKKFAKNVGAKLITLKKGGHLGSGVIIKWRIWWKVRSFLSN